MDFFSGFRDLIDRALGPEPSEEHDLHVAAAALLMLVAKVDGRILDVEERALHTLLAARFGLSEAEAERLLKIVDEAEPDLSDPQVVIDRILHEVSVEERGRLLTLGFRIAAVDGVIHDFEDDLLWRAGIRLGFSDEDVVALREEAVRHLVSPPLDMR